jgi:hypothetical protein
MIPFFYETAVIADQIPLPNATPTIAGVGVNIGGIPATIGSESMRINPVFDWSPISFANGAISLPIWVFITALFVLLLLYVILSWIFKLRRMRAVKGYVEAADKGTQEDMQVWVFGKTKKLTIECLKYWGGMIHYPLGIKITKWRHASIMSTMNIGGVPAVACSDDYDQTRDMVSEMALCAGCETFNSNQVELSKWAEENHLDVVVKPITCFTDYENYGRKLLEMVFPDGLPLDSFSIFDHTLFRKYFPKGRDADLSGGIFLRKSRKLKPKTKDQGILAKLLPIGLCVLFVGILMFGAMYVPLGK